MFKKLIPVFASFILAAASFGFTKAPATINNTESSGNEAAKTVSLTPGQKDSLRIGDLGVYIPKAGTNGELDLSRNKVAPVDHMPTQGEVRIEQPVLNFKVEQNAEHTDSYVHSRTYIYFDLTHSQETAFQNGDLAIYHFNSATNSWVELPTIWVNRGTYGRVAAVATGYGAYALGTPKTAQ